MLPMIKFLHFNIALYGLCIVIGIFAGVYIAIIRRRPYAIAKDDVIFASCYAGIGLIIGAKLLYIITLIPAIVYNIDEFIKEPSTVLLLFTGGFVYYGGLLGAGIGCYTYCKQYKLKPNAFYDLFAPSIPLMHGFGRIGCFMAGCCYGIHYEGPLHVVFSQSLGAPNGIPLFPIQLVESLINFILFFILIYYNRKPRIVGRVIGIYLISYGCIRFILEFLRGDIMRGVYFISTSQWISLLIIPCGIFCFYYLGKYKVESSINASSE